MRKVLAGSLVIFCFLATSLNAQTPKVKPRQPTTAPKPPSPTEEVDPDDVVRIDTTIVNSPVLVIGRDGRFVPNLKREDFQIFEDGIQQDIAFFAPVDKPFTVALLIDTSRSTLLDLRDIQDAAISFVDKMRTNDRALIMSFSSQIKVLAEATSDRDTLKRAIRSSRPEGSSRIYDAISFALADLDRIPGRTAIIVFSDGVDNDSREATFESTLKKIAQTQALIYPVQFSTYDKIPGANSRNRQAPEGSGFSKADYVRADAYLHQAAALSSTGVYPAQNISDLDYAIASIVDELHNEYSVGYYPVKPVQPTENRRIEVRTKLPQLVVRARTTYSLDPSGTLVRMSTTGNSTPQPGDVVGAVPMNRNLAEAKSANEGRWMCKGPNAPTDFVVVKEGFISHCPKSARSNDDTNAWFIRRPRGIETMCKGFTIWRGREFPAAPIPTGFVVTSEARSPACSRSNDDRNSSNAWLIRRPVGREIVCKGFPVPRGFVTTGETFVAGCQAKLGGKNAWVIRPR